LSTGQISISMLRTAGVGSTLRRPQSQQNIPL
jgi:hypothetical protein